MICCFEAFGKSSIVKFPQSECEDEIVDDELVDNSAVFVCESSGIDAG